MARGGGAKRGRGAGAGGGKLYYRIGEVSRITGVKPYVLRYWESEFRWMSPVKSRTNQRMYRQRDIDTIQLIKKLLYEERYTIAGARKKLRELGRLGGAPEDAEPATLPFDAEPAEHLGRIRDELRAIRALL